MLSDPGLKESSAVGCGRRITHRIFHVSDSGNQRYTSLPWLYNFFSV